MNADFFCAFKIINTSCFLGGPIKSFQLHLILCLPLCSISLKRDWIFRNLHSPPPLARCDLLGLVAVNSDSDLYNKESVLELSQVIINKMSQLVQIPDEDGVVYFVLLLVPLVMWTIGFPFGSAFIRKTECYVLHQWLGRQSNLK